MSNSLSLTWIYPLRTVMCFCIVTMTNNQQYTVLMYHHFTHNIYWAITIDVLKIRAVQISFLRMAAGVGRMEGNRNRQVCDDEYGRTGFWEWIAACTKALGEAHQDTIDIIQRLRFRKGLLVKYVREREREIKRDLLLWEESRIVCKEVDGRCVVWMSYVWKSILVVFLLWLTLAWAPQKGVWCQRS